MSWPTSFSRRSIEQHTHTHCTAIFEVFEPRLLLAVDAAGALSSDVTQLVDLNLGQGNFFAPVEIVLGADDEVFFQTSDGSSIEVWSLHDDDSEPQRLLSTKDQIRIEYALGSGEDVVLLYNHRVIETDIPEFDYQDGIDVLKAYEVSDRSAEPLQELERWSNDNALDNELRFVPLDDERVLVLHDHLDGGLERTNFWLADGDDLKPLGEESFAAIFQASVDRVVPFQDGFVFDGARLSPEGNQDQGIWALDTDAKTTTLLRNFETPVPPFGQAPQAVREVTAFGDHVYFVTDDGISGFEIWRTDGTPAGTELFADLRPNGSSNPTELTVVHDQMYFFANAGESGNQLWVTNGTAEETRVVDIDGNESLQVLETSTLDDRLIFFASNDDMVEIWSSDGTPGGTQVFASRQGSMPFRSFVTSMGGHLLYEFDAPEYGVELWVTDGTDDGTDLAIDLLDGSESSRPQKYRQRDEELIFMADDGQGFDIWSLELADVPDGTPALPGDVNNDNVVDFVDFLVVSENFGKKVADGKAAGDFNEDGDVDFIDFLLISKHFGESSGKS